MAGIFLLIIFFLFRDTGLLLHRNTVKKTKTQMKREPNLQQKTLEESLTRRLDALLEADFPSGESLDNLLEEVTGLYEKQKVSKDFFESFNARVAKIRLIQMLMENLPEPNHDRPRADFRIGNPSLSPRRLYQPELFQGFKPPPPKQGNVFDGFIFSFLLFLVVIMVFIGIIWLLSELMM